MSVIYIMINIPINSNDIIKSYLDGNSCETVAKLYNITRDKVRKILKHFNVKFRSQSESNTRYKFNHDFFNKINSQDTSYFLGFLLADGYINDKDVVLELKNEDRHILESFKNAINGNNAIKEYFKPKNGFSSKGTHTCKLFLRSPKMAKDLNKLGLNRNKTYNIIVPEISVDLEKHFWRGVLDGDGYISCYTTNSKKQKKQIDTGICGHLNTMNSFVDFLRRNQISTLGVRPDRSIFRVRVRTKDCNKFLNLLYSDANPDLFLKRKHEKYLNYLNSINN